MDWNKEYKKKLLSMEEVAAQFSSDDIVLVNMIAGEPIGILDAMAKRKDELHNVELITMGPINSLEITKPEMNGHFRFNSFIFLNNEGRTAYRQNRADYTPCHADDIPEVLTEYMLKDIPKPKLKVITDVSPMDENGYFSFGTTPGYMTETTRMENATVILEVNENQPRVYGDNFIHISEVDYLVENNHSLFSLPSAKSSPDDEAIAEYLVEVIEDGSSLQLGIGSVPNVLGELLDTKSDLGIHSEMMGDAYMRLWEKGVITGARKTLNKRKIVCCFALASEACYKWIKDNPVVEFYSQAYTNNPFIVAQGHKPVAINQCLEVDLMGQICAESLGVNQYSGTGGQVNFTAGAQANPEGKSFICLKSTAKVKGEVVSKIKPILTPGATVTTLRTDVQYVVTEYGIALLKGKSLARRTEALINIAHPDFRDELRHEAKQYGLIY